MSAPEAQRAWSAGDRAVAIAGFLAILLTGFFGDEPETRVTLAPAAVQSTPR